MAEGFRSGVEAVSKSQIECGISIGLSKFQVIRYIIELQAFSVSMPSLKCNCIFLLKETSIFVAISILDVMNVRKDLVARGTTAKTYMTKNHLYFHVIAK